MHICMTCAFDHSCTLTCYVRLVKSNCASAGRLSTPLCPLHAVLHRKYAPYASHPCHTAHHLQVNRDVKPSNLLLQLSESALPLMKLSDFSLAKDKHGSAPRSQVRRQY